MSDTSNDMDGESADGLSMYRLIDFDNLPQIEDSSDQNVSETIFEGESAAGICMLANDCSIDAVGNCPEKNEANQVIYEPACAEKNINSDEFIFKDAERNHSLDASHRWGDHSECPDRDARDRSSYGKEPEANRDVGFASSSSSPTVSHSQSHSEELAMSVKTEDNSSDSVRLVSVKRFSGAESDDRNCYGSCNMSCDPLESSELYDHSAASSDSSRKAFSNFFDTDEDSEPFGSYIVNADEIAEDDLNRSTSQGNDEEETGDLPLQQRIRRKRLYRFSSSSSEDEHSELSISSSNHSSSKSGGSSSPKVCKLDENMCTVAKDQWQQMTDIYGRQLGRQTVTMPDINFQRRVGGSLGLVQKLELYTKYERHKGCVNALSFNDSGTLIASGSDDLQIVVWDWVHRKSYIEFDSGHRANVFQSKFMPYSGDCHIVSCARDGYVRLAQLSVTGTCKGTKKLAVHKGAAHKLAILPDSCHVFLSCGEDGVTYQIDLRQDKPIKLYTTKENNRYIALYSIHAHPFNAFEHCVGGRDQFVRIYDTRKIEQNNDGAGVVKKFCPHHLVNSSIKTHVTCAVYNYNGTAVLGSYNDDDIYLFDNSHSDGANYTHKYSGHRNSATVKGVNFYGPKSEFVVSGSDCGNVYLWDVESEQVVNYFHADENGVVNVLEPHPHIPMLATSGLDNDVKLWLPTAEKPSDMEGLAKVIKKNKKNRENERNEPDIIDSEMLWFLMHRLRRSAARFEDDENDDSSSSDEDSDSNSPAEDEDDSQPVQCTQS